MQTSQRPRRGYRWPPVAAAAPGSLTENSCTLSPGRQAPRRYPGRSAHLSTPVQRPNAERVESMWSLPICGVLQAGLIAARVIVPVGAPAGWAYSPGGGTARRQTRPAPCLRPPEGGAGRPAAPEGAANARKRSTRTWTACPPKTSPPSSAAGKGEPAAAPVHPLHTPRNRQAGHAREAGEAHRPPYAAAEVAPRAAVAGHARAAGLGGCGRGHRRLPGRRRQWLTLPPAALGVHGGAAGRPRRTRPGRRPIREAHIAANAATRRLPHQRCAGSRQLPVPPAEFAAVQSRDERP
jgi:hypothetical protein